MIANLKTFKLKKCLYRIKIIKFNISKFLKTRVKMKKIKDKILIKDLVEEEVKVI